MGPKTVHQLWICCKNFFKILHNKRGQKVDEKNIEDFSQKILVWGKWMILGSKMVHPHNSGSAPRIFLKILHNERDQ